MKKVIKISLIFLILIGIASAILYYIQGLEDSSRELIKATNFERYIQSRTDKEIKNKDYKNAKEAYYSILDEINTEGSITLGDGSENLKPTEIQKCKEIAFYRYAPIFTKNAKSYFENSYWSKKQIKYYKKEAEVLLSMKIAESGTDVYNDLNYVIRVVNSYYEAWSVVASAKNCKSKSDVDAITSKSKDYLVNPFTNNTDLYDALSNVYSNAKMAYLNHVVNYANSVARNFKNYGSYLNFYDSYSNAFNKLKAYQEDYGKNDMIIEAYKRLFDTDDYALRYYSNESSN